MSTPKNLPQVFEDESIDIVALLKQVYEGRKLIFLSTIAAAVLGVIIVLVTPNSYTSGSTFIPQTGGESKPSSSLSGLASLAGINLGGLSGSSDIPPTLYPQIISSIPYRLDLLKEEINFEGEKITLRTYLNYDTGGSIFMDFKKYMIQLPKYILSTIRGDSIEEISPNQNNIYQISREDQKLFEILSSRLIIFLNEKEGFITLKFSDKDKLIAAQVADVATSLLQERIIDFKSQSARELLVFTKSQYEDNKISYERLQDSIAIFKDQNLNITNLLYQNRLDRLERELNIASSVLEQLANQLEQAKLQVNKDTPVFTVIEPVSIPFNRSGSSKILVVVAWMFLGMVLSIFFVLLKHPIKKSIDLILKEN